MQLTRITLEYSRVFNVKWFQSTPTTNQPHLEETGSDAVSRPTEVQSDNRHGGCLFLQMPFHFCPQCGTKLQPDFKFCPSCGERLPCPDDKPVAAGVTTALGLSSPEKDEPAAARTSRDSGPVHWLTEGKSDYFYDGFRVQCYSSRVRWKTSGKHWFCLTGPTFTTSSQVTARSPLQKTRNSLRLVKLDSKAVAAPGVPPGGSVRGDQNDGN